MLIILRIGIRWHDRRGFPVCSGMHVHIGMWLLTTHSEFIPQVPGHGSRHLLFTQALCFGQSEFITHSGLHSTYGSPKYSAMHEHDPAPFNSLQIALIPHGDGLQGCLGSSTMIAVIVKMKIRNK